MKIRCAIITFCLLIASATMTAGPVRRPEATYTQPDGTSFCVKVVGDEWLKIRTTEDGCSIIQDEDGWWCYAQYDAEGRISSTGYHIGKAPSEIKTAARNIPYKVLAQKAADRKSVGRENALETIEGIRKQAVMTRSGSTIIQKKAIALLVQFTDTKFRFTKEDFHNLLNQKNYKNTGSARDYYESQFGPGWEFSFDVSEVITLDHPSLYYGKNDNDGQDIRPWDMIAEACQKADSGIDFSQYDQDHNGDVDNIYVFYAGQGENEHTDKPDLIWPHQYYIYTGERINLILDGKRIDRYACSSEISGERSLTGIGTFCHEYGHTFGLADLYDTDYDDAGGWAAGTWSSTSLMDGGSYNNNSATPPNFNCLEREMLNLSEPVTLKINRLYTMDPIHISGTYCRLDTDTVGEYYLFECRSNDGWDKYIGGKGMLVYHIDKNERTTYNGRDYSVWDLNMVNAVQSHQCADIIEADGRSDRLRRYSDLDGDITGIFFPTSKVTSLGTDGTPALKYWNGKSSNLSVIGIKFIDGDISFSVRDKSYIAGVPSVSNVNYTTFPDAAIITFESSDPSLSDVKAVMNWKETNSSEDPVTISPIETEKGKYAYKIDGLTSGNVSYEVRMRFERDGSVGQEVKLPFMTKRKPSVNWPYISITSSTFNKTDGLILHVINASEASEIQWSYNDTDIVPDKDYRFRPQTDGTLKATITWADGSTDTIIKAIKVKE